MSMIYTILQNWWFILVCVAISVGLTSFILYKIFAKQFFASYSSLDADSVEEYRRSSKLRKFFELIVDRTHVESGSDVWESIYKLIRKSNQFLLFWSLETVGNSNVEEEWKYALKLNRKNFVVPLILESESIKYLPPELAKLNYIKLTSWEKRLRSKTYIVVLTSIFAIIAVGAATYFATKAIQDYFLISKIEEQKKDGGKPQLTDKPNKTPSPIPTENPSPINSPTPNQQKFLTTKEPQTQSPVNIPKPILTPIPKPSVIQSLAPIIDYFGVVLDTGGKTTNDFDPNKEYKPRSEFRLVWKVRNAEQIKITPYIIDISLNDGEIGIGIVPSKTTTYTLEATGMSGQIIKRNVTVNIRIDRITTILKAEPSPESETTSNISQPTIPTQTQPKSETTLTPPKSGTNPNPARPDPFDLEFRKPSATEIYFEAEPLSEEEITENQKNNLGLPPYGKICYQVLDAWSAKISPQIGEILISYPKRCKNIQRLIPNKKNIFTLEAKGWELDSTSSFGTKNKTFTKEVIFDLTGPKPNLGFEYTINNFESCFTPQHIRYLIIKTFKPENSSLAPDKIIVRVNPPNNKEICVIEEKNSRYDVTYVGSNGDSNSFNY
jgi:hypothetical protein